MLDSKKMDDHIFQGAPCTAIREVSLLKDLKHANIGEISISAKLSDCKGSVKDWEEEQVVVTLGGAYEAYLIIC